MEYIHGVKKKETEEEDAAERERTGWDHAVFSPVSLKRQTQLLFTLLTEFPRVPEETVKVMHLI